MIRSSLPLLLHLTPKPEQNMESTPLPQPPVFDEKLAEFDSVPLFMRSLPEDGKGDGALSALQSLVHDGTPDGG